MHWITSLPLAVSTAIALPPAAAGDLRIDRLGNWGGTCNAVAVRDQLAYISVGQRLVVLDISDPNAPVRVGESEPAGHIIVEIDLVGDLAFAAAFGAGLKIFDSQDPMRPRVIGEYRVPDAVAHVAVDGGLACIAGYDAGFWLLDVSDPTRLEELSFVPLGEAFRGDVELWDGRVHGGRARRVPARPIVGGNRIPTRRDEPRALRRQLSALPACSIASRPPWTRGRVIIKPVADRVAITQVMASIAKCAFQPSNVSRTPAQPQGTAVPERRAIE